MKISMDEPKDDFDGIFLDTGPFDSGTMLENDDLFSQVSSDLNIPDPDYLLFGREMRHVDLDFYNNFPTVFDDVVMSEDTGSETSSDLNTNVFSPSSDGLSICSTANSTPPSPQRLDTLHYDQNQNNETHLADVPNPFLPSNATPFQIQSALPTQKLPESSTFNTISSIPLGLQGAIVQFPNLNGKIPIPKIKRPVATPPSTPLVLTNDQFAKLAQGSVFKIATSNSNTTTAPIFIKTEQLSPGSTRLSGIQTVPVGTQPGYAFKTFTATSISDDSKSIKRQQRMIKNRESASLSRKKKKEFVTSLQDQLNEALNANVALKEENEKLKRRIFELECEQKLWTSTNGIFNNSNFRKGSTALLTLLFVAAINFGTQGGMKEQGEAFYESLQRQPYPDSSLNKISPLRVGRSLLWAPNEDSINKNKTDETLCSMYFNQSESIRLDSQLRGWFQVDTIENKNSSNVGPELESKHRRQFRRKSQSSHFGNPNTALDQFLPPQKPGIFHMHISKKTSSKNRQYKTNSLDVYDGKEKNFDFGSFFEAINRRKDTFYVVSFSGDHLLLPATSRNESTRPRMSLFLPSVGVTVNGTMKPPENHFSMMQIDCEVINTGLVHINEDAIPTHLSGKKKSEQRPKPAPVPSNSTVPANVSFNEHYGSNFSQKIGPKHDNVTKLNVDSKFVKGGSSSHFSNEESLLENYEEKREIKKRSRFFMAQSIEEKLTENNGLN